jgi:hypothetical protein
MAGIQEITTRNRQRVAGLEADLNAARLVQENLRDQLHKSGRCFCGAKIDWSDRHPVVVLLACGHQFHSDCFAGWGNQVNLFLRISMTILLTGTMSIWLC